MTHTTVLRRALPAAVATVAAIALAAGCGSDSDSGAQHHAAAASPAAPTPSARATFNEEDVRFAQMMIPHHEQAVQMATLAETRASDAEVKQLAAQIKGAQNPEIRTMTTWLTEWGKPTQPEGHQMHDMSSMPGMMSDHDMSMLKAAMGGEFDRMFVQMMIEHHEGAVAMARDEQDKGVNPDARKLAAAIEKTQSAEIAQLRRILDRL